MTDEKASAESGHFAQAVRGMRWMAASRVIIQVSTWALTILSLRFLHPADYGLVSIVGLITVFTTLVLEGGVTSALVHKKPESTDVYASIAAFLLLAAIIAAIGVILIAPLAAALFNQPLLTDVLRVAALQFPLMALCIVPNAMLISDMRFRDLAITQASVGITQGLVTVLLAALGLGYWALVIATLIGLAGRLALLWVYARPSFGLAIRSSQIAPYVSASRHLIPQKITWFGIQELDTFLLARTLGVAQLGIYSTAKTLSHTLLDRISEIVNQVALPAFAAKVSNRSAWMGGFMRLQSLSACITFPVFWGIAAVGPTVLPVLLGTKWAAAGWPFSLFCLIMPLRVAYSLNDTVMIGSGHTALSLGNALLWAVILGPLLIGASYWSVTAMTGAWAVGFPLVYLVSTWRIARKLALRWIDLIGSMLAPAAIAGVMWLGVQMVAVTCSEVMPLSATIILEVLFGAIVYAGGLWLFCPVRFVDLKSLLKKLVSSG